VRAIKNDPSKNIATREVRAAACVDGARRSAATVARGAA
jgi:hypothetical protein